ncbi:MAG: lysophospholipid acyltransferase family protein [Pseudolabrys sp.]
MRVVWWTSRPVYDPPDVYDHLQMPAILAMWHGQHFMAPFVQKAGDKFRAKVLISRHRDGAVNAIAAERLGVGTIRGSGAHDGGFHKGGAAAFREMLEALEEGYNIAMTADVPKVARVCGMGVIKLAQLSGKPIYAAGIASSRRKVLNNWDRSAINLPFSRIGLAGSEPIWVARDADAAALEQARRKVENELNRVTAIAYDLADGKRSAQP